MRVTRSAISALFTVVGAAAIEALASPVNSKP